MDTTANMTPSDGSNIQPLEFIICSDNRAANQDLSLEVPLQRSFIGPYAIPTSLADRKCNKVRAQDLLNVMNSIMGTSLPLFRSLHIHLNGFILENWDFGMAYSYLRPQWYSDFATLTERMNDAQCKDAALRRDALDPSKKYITNPHLPPRRVWDLYSNRVIPYYWAGLTRNVTVNGLLPVSHSWVLETERSDIQTSINGRRWPVPVPNHSSLEQVRIELLNASRANKISSEYSWLDVLCLWQKGEGSLIDDLQRLKEWETDVPTIGSIYKRAPKTLVYFNGLGIPFCNGGFNDPRHWFNRAWTVQEAASSPILEAHFSEFRTRFRDAYGDGSGSRTFSQALCSMRTRHATSELDKISGLASLAQPDRLPIYDTNQSNEAAWEILIAEIGPSARTHIFFWYPEAGDSRTRYSWAPSWPQAMAWNVPAVAAPVGLAPIRDLNRAMEHIDYNKALGSFIGQGFDGFDNCDVFGFDSDSIRWPHHSSAIRVGTIYPNVIPIGRGSYSDGRQVFEGSEDGGLRSKLRVTARHQVIVRSNVRYTLLVSKDHTRGVVGVRKDDGRFQKLCILDLARDHDDWYEPHYGYGRFDLGYNSTFREDIVLI